MEREKVYKFLRKEFCGKSEMTITEFKKAVVRTLNRPETYNLGVNNYSSEASNFISWLRKEKSEWMEIPPLRDTSEAKVVIKQPNISWVRVYGIFLHAFNVRGDSETNTCLVLREEVKGTGLKVRQLLDVLEDFTENEEDIELQVDGNLLVKNYQSLRKKLRELQQSIQLSKKDKKRVMTITRNFNFISPSGADEKITKLVTELNLAFDKIKSPDGKLYFHKEFPDGAISDYAASFITHFCFNRKLKEKDEWQPTLLDESRKRFINSNGVRVNNEYAFYLIQNEINCLWKRKQCGSPMAKNLNVNILKYFFMKVYDLKDFAFENITINEDEIILDINVPSSTVSGDGLPQPFFLKAIYGPRATYKYYYKISTPEEKELLFN